MSTFSEREQSPPPPCPDACCVVVLDTLALSSHLGLNVGPALSASPPPLGAHAESKKLHMITFDESRQFMHVLWSEQEAKKSPSPFIYR
jgi:hypothetical protein